MSFADWFKNSFDPSPLSPREVYEIIRTDKPKVRVDRPITAPSRDEFTAWRDDPTTKFVMNALARNADECREEWLRKSWDGGKADQRMLDGLRERADALNGFTASYDTFCAVLGLWPEQEEQAA